MLQVLFQKEKNLQNGQSAAISVTSVTSELVPIGQLLSYIGVGVMVAVTGYLGVQYLTSSPDKQGALKEKLVGVVVSGVVIFGAYKIWAWVVGIFEGL